MEGFNIAIYLDFENLAISAETVYPSKDKPLDIQPIIDFAIAKGNICLRKAYADWSKKLFSRYQSLLMEQGFELIHLPETNQQGKNGSDVRLAIDVIEHLYFYPEIDTIIIGSGDTDFIPLIQRVRSRSKNVIVMGFEHSVSRLVKRNSVEFKSLEELLGQAEDESISADLKQEVDLSSGRELLIRYIKSRDDDQPVLMSKLKQHLLRLDPSFSEKELGFNTFKRFLLAFSGDLLEKIDSENQTLPLVYLRDHFNEAPDQIDHKNTARHFLAKKLRYQRDAPKRMEMSRLLYNRFFVQSKMSMNQMFSFLDEKIADTLPKTEIRKYINTLFTGGAFEAYDTEMNNPLLSRPFELKEVISNADKLDQVYIRRISEILQSRYENLSDEDILELLIV